MEKNWRYKLLAILLFFSFSAKGNDKILFEKITVANGLSSNTVSSIAQDKNGRIWFATYNGLSYFDGRDYFIIKNKPSSGESMLPGNEPKYINVDRAGNIWITFDGEQLVRLINTSGKCICYPDANNKIKKYGLYPDVDNKGIFVLSNDSMCFRYNAYKDNFQRDTCSNGYIPYTVRLKKIRNKVQQFFPGIKVYSFFKEEKKEVLWVTTLSHGLLKITGNNYARAVSYTTKSPGQSAISGNEVYCVFVDKNETVWAGTKNCGVNRGIRSFYTISTQLVHGVVRAISKDTQNRLWLGTYSTGISILKGNDKTRLLFSPKQEGRWNWIRSIHQGSDGYMWVGSYAGLCRINPENLKDIKYYHPGTHPEKQTLSNKRIYSIAEDKQQNLFIGEWGSLDCLNRKTNTIKRIDIYSDLKDKKIRKLMLSNKGELWVGTKFNGVYVLDTATYKLRAHYQITKTGNNSLSSNSIFEIYEDSRGTIWIGTFSGLNSIDQTGTVKAYPQINQELPSTLIYQIFQGNQRMLWCSTIKGIVKIDVKRKNVRPYDSMDGANIREYSEGAGFMQQDRKVVFGGVGGFISFYPDSVSANPYLPNVLLNSLRVNDKNIDIPYPLDPSFTLELSPWRNNLSIDIKPILVNDPGKNKVACKLTPYENDFWYCNEEQSTINYRELPPGKYVLFAKSANADGLWSNEKKVMTIVIDKPFWQKMYFILIMISGLTAIVLLIIRFRFKQIKKQNLRLEQQIKQRTQKIEQQKTDLEQVNKMLEQRNLKVQAQKDQILAQRDHLLEMYDKQEETNQLRVNFFSNVSHDIRTPLSLIYAPVCELLKNKKLPSEIEYKIKTIHSNTEYISQLLDQIMDREKLETGGLEKVFTRGDVVNTCRLVVDSFKEQAARNHINLSFSSNVEECQLRFDHGKLKQIVFNILGNAMKFTTQGGKITCQLNIEEEQVKIEITDTGIGIPPDRIKHIFERYYQIGKSKNERSTGAGIGLSLVKDFVDLLHGKVHVESEEKKGSYFSVILPAQQPEQKRNTGPEIVLNMEQNELSSEKQAPIPAGKKLIAKNVLLVEDNDNLRSYLKDFLSGYFNVIAVENGKKAYKYLKKNNAVDIIISDWIMPEMDGIELCRAIRKKSRFQTLPFILLTALTEINNEKEAYWAGINDFIPKPFDPELVYLKISKLLNLNNQIEQKVKVSEITCPEKIEIESYNDKLLKKIMNITEQELSNVDFDPSSLARNLGISTTQLYRKLKEMVQMTPTEFIRSVRIKRAIQLLEKDSILINEISDLVGFNDPKYFSRCFAKETGMTPSKYRGLFSNNTTL